MLSWVSSYDQDRQTVKSYCEQTGFSPATYYYWKRQLEDNAPGFTSIEIIEDARLSSSTFLRLPSGLEVHNIASDQWIDLVLRFERGYAKL